MQPAPTISASLVRKHIKALLPPAAFRPNPRKLLAMALHVCVLVVGYRLLARSSSVAASAAIAVLLGHTHLCLGFLAHDLSHQSVVRNPALRYVLEALSWGLNVTAATEWRMHHNRIHHKETNTLKDSFRYFAESERSPLRSFYARWFVPNKHHRNSPLWAFTFLITNGCHTAAALFKPRAALPIMTNPGDYSRLERLRLLGELALAAALQYGVFLLVGSSWTQYLWAGPAAFLVGTTLSSIYLYTQHSLFPLLDESNPLHSVTLRLPRVVDFLHANHSQHTAHHLFPGADSRYYPAITRLLREHYPQHLVELTPVECWRRILRKDCFRRDPVPASSVAVPQLLAEAD